MSIVEDIVARYIFIFCVISLLLSANSSIFAAFSPVFATSEECAFCHTSSATALIDSEGNDLSIADDWSSTMMANSFRDPLFRAKVESEMSRNPHLADVIEDKCLTCHTPMGRTQAIRDGGESYSLSTAENSELAWDGVSCTLCHQIQGDNFGSEQSFSGNYLISNDRNIFGPYKQVFPNPMINHVNYLPVYGEQVDRPELCATCHTLFTPYIDRDGKIAGKFPEQTPFLEWLNSTYSSSENYQSCQDCHMPRIDEPVKITNRPPWYQVRQTPFWKHHFIGGNKFVLTIMRDQREHLGIMVSEAQFERTIKRTAERLGRETAGISISRLEQRGNRLMVDVGVYNKTGHKFPTGFPSRRAWIHLSVADAQGQVIFESGNYTSQGEIIGLNDSYEPHYNLVDSAEQIQIYESILGDISGTQTYTLLQAATYLKDNRLPPKGYLKSGPMAEFTTIQGDAATDNNFNVSDNLEGSGVDLVTYAIVTDGVSYPLTVKAELLYQSSNRRFLENLFTDDTPAVSRFKQMYKESDNLPVVVDSTVLDWNK